VKKPVVPIALWTVDWKSPYPGYSSNGALIKAGDKIFTVQEISEKESILHIYSAESGVSLQRISLKGKVIENGLAAAHGRLFVSLINGKLICFKE